MFFAANNISTAEENSAAENSLRTKQHLSGLKFLRLFFGIKNILFFFIITFLFNTELKAKNCLSFVPYGFNDFYVHLPQEALFCVKEAERNISYRTDTYGGRLFNNEKYNKEIQVLGDSQVLGLDVEKIDDHYLSQLYKKSFIIYAAPNNGPFEVLNFLNLNKKILNKKVIINFNFSVDIYRINNAWDPENFVALKDYHLDERLENGYQWTKKHQNRSPIELKTSSVDMKFHNCQHIQPDLTLKLPKNYWSYGMIINMERQGLKFHT